MVLPIANHHNNKQISNWIGTREREWAESIDEYNNNNNQSVVSRFIDTKIERPSWFWCQRSSLEEPSASSSFSYFAWIFRQFVWHFFLIFLLHLFFIFLSFLRSPIAGRLRFGIGSQLPTYTHTFGGLCPHKLIQFNKPKKWNFFLLLKPRMISNTRTYANGENPNGKKIWFLNCKRKIGMN